MQKVFNVNGQWDSHLLLWTRWPDHPNKQPFIWWVSSLFGSINYLYCFLQTVYGVIVPHPDLKFYLVPGCVCCDVWLYCTVSTHAPMLMSQERTLRRHNSSSFSEPSHVLIWFKIDQGMLKKCPKLQLTNQNTTEIVVYKWLGFNRSFIWQCHHNYAYRLYACVKSIYATRTFHKFSWEKGKKIHQPLTVSNVTCSSTAFKLQESMNAHTKRTQS